MHNNVRTCLCMTGGGFTKTERSCWERRRGCWQTHSSDSTPSTSGALRYPPFLTVVLQSCLLRCKARVWFSLHEVDFGKVQSEM